MTTKKTKSKPDKTFAELLAEGDELLPNRENWNTELEQYLHLLNYFAETIWSTIFDSDDKVQVSVVFCKNCSHKIEIKSKSLDFVILSAWVTQNPTSDSIYSIQLSPTNLTSDKTVRSIEELQKYLLELCKDSWFVESLNILARTHQIGNMYGQT